MTTIISPSGQKNNEFATWDIANKYRAGDLAIYTSKVYQANDLIPENTPFAIGTTGATWALAVSDTVIRDKVTNAGSVGQLQWADANANMTSNERYYIASNGTAGINASRDTPGAGFQGVIYTNTVAYTTFSGVRARGSKAAPLPVQIGDRVTSALGFPYTGNGTATLDTNTGFVTTQGAGFTTVVTSLPTSSGATPGMSVNLIATASASNSMITASFAESGNFTIPGSFVGSGASLGSVDNVKITGGTSGQVISTDGTGNLSWTTAGGGGGTTLPNGTSPFEILAWQYDGVTPSWQIGPNPVYWNLPVNNTDAAYVTAVNAVGQGLQEGSRYYNTTNEVLRVYDGGAWQDAGSGVTPTTVAALGTKPQGFRAFVTDSQTPASAGFGSPVTGGGSNKTPVWSDGISWFIG